MSDDQAMGAVALAFTAIALLLFFLASWRRKRRAR